LIDFEREIGAADLRFPKIVPDRHSAATWAALSIRLAMRLPAGGLPRRWRSRMIVSQMIRASTLTSDRRKLNRPWPLLA